MIDLPDIEDRVATKRAAEILGVSEVRVRQLAQGGRLEFVEVQLPGRPTR